MPKSNLVSALNAALAGKSALPDGPAPSPAASPAADDFLISALRHSTTGRDQIMQRRIGILPDDSA